MIICVIFWIQPLSTFVICCYKLNNTQVCDEHLFRQVSRSKSRNQLPISCCTNGHLGRHTRLFRRAILDDVMSQSALVKIYSCPLNRVMKKITQSGDLKSDHLKSRNIWNPEFLKVGFHMVWFSKGRALAMAIAMIPTIWKPDHSKFECFCTDFKWFWTK